MQELRESYDMDPAAESQKIKKMPARYKKWGKVR